MNFNWWDNRILLSDVKLKKILNYVNKIKFPNRWPMAAAPDRIRQRDGFTDAMIFLLTIVH